MLTFLMLALWRMGKGKAADGKKWQLVWIKRLQLKPWRLCYYISIHNIQEILMERKQKEEKHRSKKNQKQGRVYRNMKLKNIVKKESVANQLERMAKASDHRLKSRDQSPSQAHSSHIDFANSFGWFIGIHHCNISPFTKSDCYSTLREDPQRDYLQAPPQMQQNLKNGQHTNKRCSGNFVPETFT